MSEAPGPAELATTQLLPYLAVGGNEEAWRVLSYATGRDSRLVPPAASGRRRGGGLARAAQAGRGPGPRGVPAERSGQLPRLAAPGGRQRGRGPGPAATLEPGGRRRLSCWPDPASVDELAGELDEQFQADCQRAELVCARVRDRVQMHTWEAFARTYLEGQEVREVARDLGLTLSGVYKARDRVRRLLEEEGQAESLPSVGNGAPP